jgi:hypothetical protein
VRVVFRRIEEPCVATVEGDRGVERHEIWPVIVDVVVRGERVPLRFAWNRFERVLWVDERWPGRAQSLSCQLGRDRAGFDVSQERAAAERASKG